MCGIFGYCSYLKPKVRLYDSFRSSAVRRRCCEGHSLPVSLATGIEHLSENIAHPAPLTNHTN